MIIAQRISIQLKAYLRLESLNHDALSDPTYTKTITSHMCDSDQVAQSNDKTDIFVIQLNVINSK